MNLESIETVGEAEQYLQIAREELKVQREVFVKPLREERHRVQHLIKSLPDELVGEVTIELPMGTLTVDDPEEYEDAIEVLKTYRERVLHQLDAHEQQYDRQRDRLIRLFRQIQQTKRAHAGQQSGQEARAAVVDDGGNPASKGGAPQ